MNPEYASKSGYGTSASVELAKNNIQITENNGEAQDEGSSTFWTDGFRECEKSP